MRALLFSFVFLFGCFPIHISGSNVPTDNTTLLTAADIAAAEGYLESCRVDLVSNNAQEVVDQALAELKERHIRIVEREKLTFTTAFRTRLEVKKGFWDEPVAYQAATLTHELVHYCQRRDLGNLTFEKSYANSPGRWRIEVPAVAQDIRTAVAVGFEDWSPRKYIDEKLPGMRDFYMLHDLDPIQYELETRRIWESVLD